MSVNEIKGELDRMSASERAQVQGYLRILRWKENPSLADRLTQAHSKMDEGGKITADRVERHLDRLRNTKE